MVQTAPLDLVAQGLLVAAAITLLLAVSRLRRRGRRWPWARSAASLGGLICIWVAVGSRMASYDDTNVTVHVVQHLLLMMVAPALLALGHPVTLIAQVANRPLQIRLARSLRSPVSRWLTHPIPATALYLGSMYAMLTSRSVYGFLTTHQLAHDASHAWLVTAGWLYWEPMLGGVGSRTSYPVRLAAVLAVMPFEAMIGIWLRYQSSPVSSVGTVHDTQRAGETFVVGSTLLSTIWLGVIVGKWAAKAWREERRASLTPATREWTTPWWASPKPEVSGSAGSP